MFGAGAGADAAREAAIRNVERSGDIDDAVDDVILDKLLADEVRAERAGLDAGAGPGGLGGPDDEADESGDAADWAAVERALKSWKPNVEFTTQCLSDAARARQTSAIGGPHRPWQLSIVARGSDVHLVHWNDPLVREGRRCNVDDSGKVIWPTASSDLYPKESWRNDLVLHPAIGIRAKRDRLLRETVPAHVLHYFKMMQLSLLREADVSLSFPSFGLCYICGTGDKAYTGDDADELAKEVHINSLYVRTCCLCMMEMHYDCSERVSSTLEEAVANPTARPEIIGLLPPRPEVELFPFRQVHPVESYCTCHICQLWLHYTGQTTLPAE